MLLSDLMLIHFTSYFGAVVFFLLFFVTDMLLSCFDANTLQSVHMEFMSRSLFFPITSL